MNKKNYINIYNNLIKFSRNKSIFYSFTKEDTFSDRLLIFLFHFAFFLRNFKNNQEKQILQELYDYIFKQLEISIREIGYGDASINKKMKSYVNSLYLILKKIDKWENLSLSEKNSIFNNLLDYSDDSSFLSEYFDKYLIFLQNNSFNLFVNGVINTKI